MAERRGPVRTGRPGAAAGLLLAMVLALLAGGGTSGASGAGQSRAGWGPVVDVTPERPWVFGPAVAVDPRGVAVAVWPRGTQGRSHLFLASRRPGGRWTAAVRIPGTRGAAEAELAFDGSRDLVLAWTSGRHVEAARRTVAGRWTVPATLHTTPAGVRGTIPGNLRLAVNTAGRAVVAWETVDDDQDSTYARPAAQAVVGTAAGGWGRVATLSSARHHGVRPQVAIDASGRVTAVWSESVDGRGRAMARSRAAGGSWTPARVLSARGVDVNPPQVAVRPAGDVVVAWTRVGAHRDGVVVRRSSGTGGWQPEHRVPAPRTATSWSAVGVDGAGTATVSWVTRRGAVWAVDESRTRTWGPLVRIAPTGSVFYGLDLVVDRAGDALLAWETWTGTTHRIDVAHRQGSAPWGPATGLSAARYDAAGPAVALEHDGDAVVAWVATRDYRSDVSRIQARSFTAR